MTSRPAAPVTEIGGCVMSGDPVTRYGADRRSRRALRATIATVALLGVGRDGTVVVRGGHDVDDARTWQQRFEDLARR